MSVRNRDGATVVAHLPGKRDCLVRIYERRSRPGDFFIRWQNPVTGKSMQRERAGKAAAMKYAEQICEEIQLARKGQRIERMTVADRERMNLSRRIPIEKLRAWVEEYESMARRSTVEQWRLQWLANEDHEWARSTLQDYEGRTRIFAATFGHRYLDEITAEEVKAWRDDFIDEDSSKGSKRNANNYLGAVRAMFSGARRAGLLPEGRETAPEKLTHFRKVKSEIQIFDFETVVKMLADLPDNSRHRVYFLLSIFMPFRPSDLTGIKGDRRGLRWEAFRWDERLVDLGPETAGKGRARMMEIPEVLIDWLAPDRAEKGQVARTDSSHQVSRHFRERLGIEWQSDVLRHTVISHLLARTRNEIGWVTDQAGNSESEVRKKYRVPVSEAEGKAYFSLSPTRVNELMAEKR